MKRFRLLPLLAGILLAVPSGRAEATSITFYFTFASWFTALNAAGYSSTVETFDSYLNGSIGSFAVGGVNFNGALGTVSNGTIVSDLRVGPDYAAGSITGAPLFGFAIESASGIDVMGGQAFATDGFNLNTGIQTTFFGVLSDTPLRSIQMFADGLLQNPGGRMDNLRVATAATTVPEPSALVLVGVGLVAISARRRFAQARSSV